MGITRRKHRWIISFVLFNSVLIYVVKSFSSIVQPSQVEEITKYARKWQSRNVNNEEQSKILYDASQLETAKCSEWNTSESLMIVPLCLRNRNTSDNRTPKIVMFTSAEDNTKRRIIHSTTLNLWKQLPLTPILFLVNPRKEMFLLHEACRKGWDVYVAPFCNGFDLPVLRSMFEVVQREYPEYDFYGYANSDMVFDASLIRTLGRLNQFSKSQVPSLLATGRRTQIKIALNESMSNLLELEAIRKLHGSDGFVIAEDFFISRSDFPWTSFPPVVIGRRGFDNFLIYFANKYNFSTIDVSSSVVAVHLGGTEAYDASRKRRGAAINMKITGQFDFTLGVVTCSHLRTGINLNGSIALNEVTKKGFCGQKDWVRRREHFDEMAKRTRQEEMWPQ